MKRVIISTGLVLALAAFMQAQDNAQVSTTQTTTTQTTQSADQNSTDATNSSNAPASTQATSTTSKKSKNWGAGKPEGTHVSKHETDTLVQPTNAPVKVNPTVVKNAQQKLNDAGYDAGPADGHMGPQTSAALMRFQADKNLDQTGRLDQKTMAALNVGGVQTLKAAPRDIGRAGKAIGHNAAGGHPVAAGKAAVTGGKNVGKKVGEGTESTAVKVKDKVGSGISAIGNKISGAGEKTKNAGEATEQKAPDNNSGNNTTSTTNNPPRK